MAVHIGSEVKRRFDESGMTLVAFAERIGRSSKNVYEVFKRPSMDTMLLQRCSEALHFNFFQLYSDDLAPTLAGTTVNEPPAPYGKARKPTVIVIQGDAQDGKLVERITRALGGEE